MSNIQKQWQELTENLTKAGNMFDGHVTHGSIAEQLKVIDEFLRNYADLCDGDESVYGRGVYGQYKND